MATDLSILLILVFTCCFSPSFAGSYFGASWRSYASRKELGTKEVNQENVIQLGHALPPNRIDPSQVTQLSWRPRVFLYKGFLSNEECDHLISLGNDNKEKSSGNNSMKVVERTKNIDIIAEIEDKITSRIEERISAWTFLPKGNGKPFNILHCGAEEAKQTYNYMGNNTSTQLTGESVMATVVMYLSDVTQGGQILFPGAESGSSKVKNKIWSNCTKSSHTIQPTKGNAILFFNLHPNTSLDPTSSHARCPIIEGDMWWATKVFVVKSVQEKPVVSEAVDEPCTDEDDHCPTWAAVGECERNPIFMIGTVDYYGTCRKSCNVC